MNSGDADRLARVIVWTMVLMLCILAWIGFIKLVWWLL